MSLFNTREWWSTQLVDEEGFGDKSIVVANVDNTPDNKDKIVIGSLSGLLRIFAINGSESLGGYQASDLLLETELKYPVLQLLVGAFLAASDKLHLAVLHPRKLSIYSVAGTAGFSEHGSSYNILLIYEHNLQRTAFNMIAGHFGQVKGRDFFCVQSLDGTLSFYEQESFAFSRFLPNFLLPGPIGYVADTDSFVLSTSCWALESYRYQVLAISKDGDKEDASGTTGRGRRVTPDWSIVIGEAILDIEVVHVEKKSSCIVVLGERTLLVVKENGSTLFLKKLDYTPSCMHSYLNNEYLMVAVCTEHQSILVYNSEALKWAAQLPFVPIAVKRATLSDIRGALIFLSGSGFLSCNYLGTAPSLNIVTVNTSENITNYAEAEVELQELKKIISAFNADPTASGLAGGATLGTKSARSHSSELEITVSGPLEIRSETVTARRASEVNIRPKLRYSIQIQVDASVTNVRLMVQVPKPLAIDSGVFTFPSLTASTDVKQVQVTVTLEESHLPPDLKMNVVAAYSNSTGAPRVQQKDVHLPLNLIARLAPASKETELTISLDVVCHASLDLSELFHDLVQSSERVLMSELQSTLGIHFLDEATASVTVSISTRPPKQKFRLKSDSFTGLSFVSCELIQRLQTRGVKFDTAVLDKSSLPLEAYLRLIDEHLMARQLLTEKQSMLAKYATQYRTIEKRFLVKLKDRNPTPLNDLDILLENVHSKIMTLGDELIDLVEEIKKKTNALSSATDLILKIISIGTSMKPDQVNHFRAMVTPHINADVEEGWEERTEIALINLLASHLKDVNDVAKYNQCALVMPKTFEKLRNLIVKLVDKTYAGEVLVCAKNIGSSTTEANASTVKSNFVLPSNEIIPEEEEGNDEDANSLSANAFNFVG